MTRALSFVLALVACTTPRPAPNRPEPSPPMPPVAETDPGTPPPTESSTEAPPATPPANDVPSTPLPPEPPPIPPVPGSAAHCLYVGAEQRVVRCYWENKACTNQIAFNKETGLDQSQECKSVGEVHCFTASKSESCYPTASECSKNVSGMRQRNREASDCVVKTHP